MGCFIYASIWNLEKQIDKNNFYFLRKGNEMQNIINTRDKNEMNKISLK